MKAATIIEIKKELKYRSQEQLVVVRVVGVAVPDAHVGIVVARLDEHVEDHRELREGTPG